MDIKQNYFHFWEALTWPLLGSIVSTPTNIYWEVMPAKGWPASLNFTLGKEKKSAQAKLDEWSGCFISWIDFMAMYSLTMPKFLYRSIPQCHNYFVLASLGLTCLIFSQKLGEGLHNVFCIDGGHPGHLVCVHDPLIVKEPPISFF